MLSHQKSLIARYIFLWLFFIPGLIEANELPIEFSFFQLHALSKSEVDQEKLIGKIGHPLVRMRGFLYPSGSHWVLAAQPNLKSCCVGNLSKKNEQIFIKHIQGYDSQTRQAVLVEGKLIVNFQHAFPYQFDTATIIEEADSSKKLQAYFLGLALIGIVWILGCFIVNRMR